LRMTNEGKRTGNTTHGNEQPGTKQRVGPDVVISNSGCQKSRFNDQRKNKGKGLKELARPFTLGTVDGHVRESGTGGNRARITLAKVPREHQSEELRTPGLLLDGHRNSKETRISWHTSVRPYP